MKNVILFIFCSLCIACSQSPQIEHVIAEPTVIYNDIESRMPGSLLILDHYAIWSDPLSSDNQIHVINLHSKQEIGKFLTIGNGPNEFISPNFCLSSKRELAVFDQSQDKMAFYSIDSLEKGSNPLVATVKTPTQGYTRMANMQERDFIFLKPDNRQPLLSGSDRQPFGISPFEKEGEIQNSFNVMQGNIAYNTDKSILVYAPIHFPYMAAYAKDKKSDRFRLLWERKGEAEYSISEKKIILDKTKKGAMELALTKDYIVTLQRDYQTDPTDESTVGRDIGKIPQTLFVYDYQSNLKRIIDFNVPILRIGSNTANNTIYAIVVNPDFCLVEYNIGNLSD